MQKECNLQTIREYEKKVDLLDEQIGKISIKIAALNKANRIGSYSLAYLEEVPTNTRLFSSVGKMFFREDRENIMGSLENSISMTNDELPKLREALQKFESRKKEQVQAIQELYESIKMIST